MTTSAISSPTISGSYSTEQVALATAATLLACYIGYRILTTPSSQPQPLNPHAQPKYTKLPTTPIAPNLKEPPPPQDTIKRVFKHVIPDAILKACLEPATGLKKCKYETKCSMGNPNHYLSENSHPEGKCSYNARCTSDKMGHLLGFDHTLEQIIQGHAKNIKAPNQGDVRQVSFKTTLPHRSTEAIHDLVVTGNVDLPDPVNGTGFSKEFLLSAFFHGVNIASKQFAKLGNTKVPIYENGERKLATIADLHKAGKMKYCFGPSHHALELVAATVLKQHQTKKTIAPFGDPKDGFKWAEMQNTKGIQKINQNNGLHLVTGCYHSTSNSAARNIFEEVKMVGGGYLGQGMYFTCSPSKDGEGIDVDAALKTSEYGLLHSGVMIVSLVIGYDGVRYVEGIDKEQPQRKDWDLKYLRPGIKKGITNSGDDQNGAAELLATSPAQVIPLGIIYIENAYLGGDEQMKRAEILSKVEENSRQIEGNL